MIVIAGTIEVDPERSGDFSAAAEKLVALSRDEPGCGSYGFWLSPSDPGTFHIFEEWADDAALAAHGGSAHYQAFAKSLPDFGVRGASVHRYDASSKQPLGG